MAVRSCGNWLALQRDPVDYSVSPYSSRKCRDKRNARIYGSGGAGDPMLERTVGKRKGKDGECYASSGIGLGDNGGMTIAMPNVMQMLGRRTLRRLRLIPATTMDQHADSWNAALQGFSPRRGTTVPSKCPGGAAFHFRWVHARQRDRVTGSLARSLCGRSRGEIIAPNITIALHTPNSLCAK